MPKIASVWAREVLDSRGNPTVEVEVFCDGLMASAIAPSGASTGKHEVKELRDGGARYRGKGVLKAVKNVREKIGPAIVGMEVSDQEAIDSRMMELDGSRDLSILGGNAVVATSMACLRMRSLIEKKPLFLLWGKAKLPYPLFNIINGGKHAGNDLAIQEFMVVPQQKMFSERLRCCAEIYHALGELLSAKYGKGAKNVGDEGGYAPPMKNTYEALEMLEGAIEESGYKGEVKLALDCAATTFYKNGKYQIDGQRFSGGELLDFYLDIVKGYPIFSIEDPFEEEDFESFAKLKEKGVNVVGDDLTVSNPQRVKTAIEKSAISSIILKVNQVGTITQALKTVEICRENGVNVIVSHRSGETEDTFIADFAVGLGCGYIKSGAPCRGERTCKYNQLLRIEEYLSV